ncbi:hypothetical protein B0H34DRAFT_675072 [Crassisporium funariophilum]|nr:hypothetical protein B0H34DRAFT_675072 [Crassisporium funariophilum]
MDLASERGSCQVKPANYRLDGDPGWPTRGRAIRTLTTCVFKVRNGGTCVTKLRRSLSRWPNVPEMERNPNGLPSKRSTFQGRRDRLLITKGKPENSRLAHGTPLDGGFAAAAASMPIHASDRSMERTSTQGTDGANTRVVRCSFKFLELTCPVAEMGIQAYICSSSPSIQSVFLLPQGPTSMCCAQDENNKCIRITVPYTRNARLKRDAGKSVRERCSLPPRCQHPYVRLFSLCNDKHNDEDINQPSAMSIVGFRENRAFMLTHANSKENQIIGNRNDIDGSRRNIRGMTKKISRIEQTASNLDRKLSIRRVVSRYRGIENMREERGGIAPGRKRKELSFVHDGDRGRYKKRK